MGQFEIPERRRSGVIRLVVRALSRVDIHFRLTSTAASQAKPRSLPAPFSYRVATRRDRLTAPTNRSIAVRCR